MKTLISGATLPCHITMCFSTVCVVNMQNKKKSGSILSCLTCRNTPNPSAVV